jgi:hypothetical protein
MDTAAFTDLWHDVCSRICRGRQPSHSVEPRFVEDLISHLALQPEDVFYVLGSGTGAVRAPRHQLNDEFRKSISIFNLNQFIIYLFIIAAGGLAGGGPDRVPRGGCGR